MNVAEKRFMKNKNNQKAAASKKGGANMQQS